MDKKNKKLKTLEALKTKEFWGHPSSTDYIADLIKKHGLRMTTQRRALINVLNTSKTSLSIKQIYSKMCEKKIKIDEASVYRITEALKDLNIVHIHFNGKVKLCSHLACEQNFHLSLECQMCQKVQEPHLSSTDENQLADILKLKPKSITHLHVDYICKKCEA